MKLNGERESRHLTFEERIALQAEEIKRLQQENEQYKKRLKEIETTAKAIIRDRTEQDKVLIMAEDIERMCGIVGEKITKVLVYRNRELQQENEQLRAQVARMRDALEHIAEYWNRDNNEKAMEDACWHAIETAEEVLSTDADKDYHNPADVEKIKQLENTIEIMAHAHIEINHKQIEALRKAREVMTTWLCARTQQGKQAKREALAAIEKAIGGKAIGGGEK